VVRSWHSRKIVQVNSRVGASTSRDYLKFSGKRFGGRASENKYMQHRASVWTAAVDSNGVAAGAKVVQELLEVLTDDLG
jgi:hypothetical protein